MEEERDEHVSSLAHEIKHKYDKQSKKYALIGLDAEYQATQQRGTFGIPAIDRDFYRNMYYIHAIENLVRPTEVAYSMKRKNITKSQFKDFLENNRVYKELVQIKNFTFDDFISRLKEQEERVKKDNPFFVQSIKNIDTSGCGVVSLNMMETLYGKKM
jgi:hypothetical protein